MVSPHIAVFGTDGAQREPIYIRSHEEKICGFFGEGKRFQKNPGTGFLCRFTARRYFLSLRRLSSSTKAWCSGEFKPSWSLANTWDILPPRNAEPSNQRPG